jgi:hypothetical protein
MGGLQIDRVTEVPRWADFLSLAQWRALLVALQQELAARGVVARYQGEHFSAMLPDGRSGRLTLDGFARRCRGVAVEDYPREARASLDVALGPMPARAREPVALESFAEVAPSLIAHVYLDAMVGPVRSTIIARPLCAELVTAVAVDFGHAIGSLPREVAAVWGRSDDELLRVGLANVQKRAVRRESLPARGLPGFMLTGQDHAVTSQVHFLGEHLRGHFPAGALVALPTRNLLLCVPLQTCDALGSLERIAGTVATVHGLFDELAEHARNHEQMFSPHLYWWRDGALTALPAAMTSHGPVIAPSQDLLTAVLSQRSVCDA